jgi:hypothetical protein
VSVRAASAVLALVALSACATERAPRPRPPTPAEVRARAERALPAQTKQRAGWAADLQAALAALDLPPSDSHLCSVIAIVAQESGFEADPPVANLPKIARAEIDERAARVGVPRVAVGVALKLPSPDGRSYAERLATVRTEGELSLLFEDFLGSVPLGEKLFGGWNPVRTGGSMQVSIAFAETFAEQRGYPYPIEVSIRREVFTRRGGLYFGIAHLLDYEARYDAPIYRFADFNAGRWASRNAAFQAAVSRATGIPLATDGDLIRRGAAAAKGPGATETATRALGSRIGASDAEIRRALEAGDGPGFERTDVYEAVFAIADDVAGKRLPRARIPDIVLHGPKIQRKLTTRWFAERVDGRHRACMQKLRPAPAAKEPPRKKR